MSTLFNPDKEKYEISVWEDSLVPQTTEGEKTILEHFEEYKIATIGAHDMDSSAAASNPIFVENVNGSYTLTFLMYYKYFDEDEMDYVENPFTQLLHNERKIKLFYRNKWYDLVIKNCVEDSSNYTYTYTAKSLYTTELGKNGFKVELDNELENNQGTVTELGKTILKGTDWEIAPTKEELTDDEIAEWEAKYGEDSYSDIIVQTKIEPLYIGVLNQDIEIQLVNSYIPDKEEKDDELMAITQIAAGQKVLFFYSDINNNEPQPQILFRPDGDYKTDINEDIITNSYNYRIISPEITYVDTEISYNVPSVCYDSQDSENDPKFTVYDNSRGEKVIRSAKTGYDPDLDKFITHYKKDGDETIYYGYQKTESLSSHLTQNFLANSDDFTSVDTGWLFDGTPSVSNLKEDGTIIDDADTTYTGQIYLLNQEGFAYDPNNEGGAESVMVMRLREGTETDYYHDSGGHLYKIEKKIIQEGSTDTITQTDYISVDSDDGRSFEIQIKQRYETLRAQGHEKFVNLTDEELQKIIDSALLNMRYSNRSRRAINTGMAANRKIIENLSNGEEYVFAVSLGKYKETEEAPEYGREIKYGATTPTELFVFSEKGNADIDAVVSEEAYLKAYKEVTENPQRYLEVDEKGNITDAIYKEAYNTYVTAASIEYENRYIEDKWLIGKVVDPDAKKNWERGGKDFRAKFKEYLTTVTASNAVLENGATLEPEKDLNGKNIEIIPDEVKDNIEECSFINSVISILSGNEIETYRALYEALKDPFFNAWSKAYIDKCNKRATTSDFLWISRKNNWITSGNDGKYPDYDGDKEYSEISNGALNGDYSSINSFCGQLFWNLFVAIRDKYIDIKLNDEGQIDQTTFSIIIPKPDSLKKLIEQTFDNLVDQMGILGSYKAKKDYELPSWFNKNGGVKYQQHKASWEENGREHALQVVLKSDTFTSKFSYGTYTPELDTNNNNYKDFQGEVQFLNDFKTEWEKAIQNFNEISAPSYIGTDEYYKTIKDKFQEAWKTWVSRWNTDPYWKEKTTGKWLNGTEYNKILEDFRKDYEKNLPEGEEINEEEFNVALQKIKDNYTLIKLTQDLIDGEINEREESKCGWGFSEIYFNLKDLIFKEKTQTATYTINNEEYSLNNPEEKGENIATSNIYIQDSNGKWNLTSIETSDNGAEYIAYEDEENGYYVFDRQKQKIRLFDPKIDREKPTYLPIKNDNGSYIYDEVRGVYRKFRDWYKTEYKDLKTGEPLEQIKGGYPGDVIYHDVQWFDGHIGSWDEKPQRYDMIRTYEDEEERKYLKDSETYIWRKNEAPTFLEKVKEFLTFWDGDLEADNTLIEYEYSYPIGFQLDKFIEDENGPYIKMDYANELKDDFISIGTISTSQEVSAYTTRAATETTVIGRVWQWIKEEVVQPVIDFGHQLEEWVEQGIDKITNEVERAIAQAIQNIYSLAEQYGISTKEIGLLFDNLNVKNESDYKENQYRFFMSLKEVLVPNFDDNELREELIAAGRLKARQVSEQKARNSAEEKLPTPIEGEIKYVKYRWWYWRHWGKKRYSLKEKLCVPTTNEDEFKVYNNIEDAVSKNYSVELVAKYTGSQDKKAFYLREKQISYRLLVDTDFSPNIFEMLPDEKMDKTHCVYNNYYNYYRPYKDGDAKIDLKDNNFGFWCQTYNPTTREEYEGVIDNLQNPCMLVDGIYIPYDKRTYNLGLRRFYRKREFPDSSEIQDADLMTYYVYHNGNYISLYDYYKNYSKTSELNYEGLKIYFTPEYTYDATNFAIQIDEEKAFNYNQDGTIETPKYLGLTIETEPDGYFDTSVYNKTIIEEGVKERWCYWKIKVNEGISLIEDQLSSIGLVFESTVSPQNGVYKDYAFLGMQLFKYFEYESKKIEGYEELIEEGELFFDKTYLVKADEKLNKLLEEIDFSNLFQSNSEMTSLVQISAVATETFGYIQDFLSNKGYTLTKISSSTTSTEQLKYSYQLKQIKEHPILPVVPGQAPDAKDLVITNYYIYDPTQSTSNEDVVYSYRGQNPESEGFKVNYDELCQKIRSIKGKESNYFKLLQDSCDTFECWMEQLIPHDNMGRVQYIEKPVYEQANIEENEEPQIYVGSLPNGLTEKEYPLKGYIKVPDKKIRFKEYVGRPNYVGFKYGVNLQSIRRTVDSESIATRTIVKPNSNEYATDGFCTIQRAEENILKENFIYDFTYYINKGLLKYSEINPDLYSSNPDKLSYYVKLARLNKENDQIILDLSAVMIELDKANADYETAVLGRDAAQEEIAKLIEIFKNNYDTYGNLIDVPWTFNKSKEYAQKTQTSSQEHPAKINGPDGTYDIIIPAMTTTVDYPKYNDTLRNYFDQMDTFQRNYEKFKNAAIEAKANKEKYEAERDRLLKLEKEIVEKKNELNKLFYHKYSRYIQEGSWIDENYIDDNLYYLDALAVSRTSSVPKITYDIKVVDLYGAIGYEEDREILDFLLGDRTYVEDTDFFGYIKDTGRPYQEQIVVTEKTYVLEDNSQNKIQVKNYSTQFDSLFQRIAATSQTLQFNEGSYGRVSSILNNDGSINADRLQQALDSTSLAFKNSINEDVYWDHTGIWVKSFETDANILRMTSLGIGLSTDGGNTYMTAITGAGINAAAITSGMLNVDNLMIGAKSAPNFLWNKFGISSFKTLEGGIDYSTFVRLDQYGVYGIKNWSKNGIIPEQMSINDTFEPLRLSDITENENAVFGLTWDGFFLNTGSGADRGRVTIGTNQDIRMSVKDDSGWRDRVVIGRMTDITTNEQTYGFRLINENGEIVMDTNLQGELYLKRKLRISNFTNEIRYDQDLKYDENGNIVQGDKPTFTNVEDRVTLGIVNTYDRQDNYKKIELSGPYNSSRYLTKVLSVKSNDTVGIEQFNQNILDKVLDENENFAVFDNGNLFAKNAWIEGNIRATSGDILGELVIGREGAGTLRHENNSWKLLSDGTALFNNVTVSGTITSAVFEYNKVQTVGGAMLLRPTVNIENVKIFYIDEQGKEITISNEEDNSYAHIYEITINGDIPEDFSEGSLCQIGNERTIVDSKTKTHIIYYTKKRAISGIINNIKSLSELPASFDLKSFDNSSVLYLSILSSEITKEIENTDVLFNVAPYFNDNFETVTALSLNASKQDLGYIPNEGFSIIELQYQKLGENTEDYFIANHILAKFGKLSESVISSYQNNKAVYDKVKDTYGLYCENVLLQGSILSTNEGINAGISTERIIQRNRLNEIGEEEKDEDGRPILTNLIFWSIGSSKTEDTAPQFYVTEEGMMYAEKGVFKGSIYASKIFTADVYGSDKGEYGLKIHSSKDDNVDNAIWFGSEEQDFFTLASDKASYFIDLQVLNDEKQVILKTIKDGTNGINLLNENLCIYRKDVYNDNQQINGGVDFNVKTDTIFSLLQNEFAFNEKTKITYGEKTYVKIINEENNCGVDIYITE